MAGKTFPAKYPGTCKYCGGSIVKGMSIGYHKGKAWHAGCAPTGHPKEDAEYMAGVADANRYLENKKIYGAELAEKWAAEDEWNRYWKYGEDY